MCKPLYDFCLKRASSTNRRDALVLDLRSRLVRAYAPDNWQSRSRLESCRCRQPGSWRDSQAYTKSGQSETPLRRANASAKTAGKRAHYAHRRYVTGCSTIDLSILRESRNTPVALSVYQDILQSVVLRNFSFWYAVNAVQRTNQMNRSFNRRA